MFRYNSLVRKSNLRFYKNKKNILSKSIESSSKIIASYKKTLDNQLSIIEKIIKYFLSAFLFPFGFRLVKANHIITLFTFGKFDGYITSELKWFSPISKGYETYCGDIILNYNNMYLTDVLSNPIRVNSFITYNYN